MDTGGLADRTFRDLERANERLIGNKKHGTSKNTIGTFSKYHLLDDIYPEDVRSLKSKLAKRSKVSARLRPEMTTVRSVFNFAMRNDFTERIPKFGDDFAPTAEKAIKRHRAK